METIPTHEFFRTSIKLKFKDADPAGIMFFGNILGITHDIFEEFLSWNKIQWSEWFNDEVWACPIRHTEVDFLSPLYPGQDYAVGAKVSKLGNTSFNMHYEFRNHSGKLCARVQMTHAFIDKKSLFKTEIPSQFIPILKKYYLETTLS